MREQYELENKQKYLCMLKVSQKSIIYANVYWLSL